MSITIRLGTVERTLIWNWPSWHWWPSYQCWHYAREHDRRRSYSRTRIGPFRFDVTRWWPWGLG